MNSKKTIPLESGKADSYSVEVMSKMNTMTLRFSMSYLHLRQCLRRASKAVDAYGLVAGHTSSQCDAEQAYVQSRFGGTETWVRIPKDRRPAEWVGKFRKPVVLLTLPLYGHPDAGGYWEFRCKEKLIARGSPRFMIRTACIGTVRILRLLLMVCVDDFKMSGPMENMSEGWKLIRTSIETDEPSPHH